MENFRSTGIEWAGQTLVHPVGLAMLMVAAVAVLTAPRRYAVIPIFILACFVARQRIVIATLDFDFLRLIILVGWMRVLTRGELRGFTWKPIDTAFLLYAISGFVIYVLQQQTTGSLTLMCGRTIDGAGSYFLFRCLIRSWDDVYALASGIAIVAAPVSLAFIFEKLTGRNAFAAFGGVPEFTAIRQGRLRAQGAFAHPILAGCFWATLAPILVAMWWKGATHKMLAIVGFGASMVIIVACASSTPLIALIMSAFAASLFPLRKRMRTVRWGLLFTLVVLHLVKTRPVWHMFVYANLIGGSTGWHRFNLIDQAIRRIPEWAVLGTTSTAHWGSGLHDVTNQFVLDGVRGGMVTMLLLILVIVHAFGHVGRACRALDHDRAKRAMAWGLGVAIFAHVMSFFSVSYFGQINILWTLTLALAGSVGLSKRQYAALARAGRNAPPAKASRPAPAQPPAPAGAAQPST